MGRKVVLSLGMMLVVILSAGLAGGQVDGDAAGGGLLWWGNHEPIYIYGDDDFTVANGVMSGCGTIDDPYVIEGWRVDAPRADYGIYIDHTSAHFVIRDCVVERARVAGVYFNSVRNGRVESLQIQRSDTAIYFLNSDRNAVRDSVIAECDFGIVMAAGSDGNKISGNSFFDNGLAAKDPRRENCWCLDGRGNYWSGFEGCDVDGDGVYDTPNYRFGDPCPLVEPPVEWTGVTTAGLSFPGHWVAPDGSLVVTSQTPIALQAADPGAGLAEIRYAIDGGVWMTYTGPIRLTGDDGPRTIRYYGIDNLGNAEPVRSVSFVLDNHPPETELEFGEPVYRDERGIWITSKTPIILRRTQESTYGRTLTYFRIDGRNWQIYHGPFVLHAADGPHQISYYSRNASGVSEALKSVVVLKDDTPPSTRGGRTVSLTEVIVGPSEDEPQEETAPIEVPTPAEAPEEPDMPAEGEAQSPSEMPPATLPPTEPSVQTSSDTVNGSGDEEEGGAVQTPSETAPQTPSESTG